jgi:tRNA wybutosine-synthesizing protein 3
MIVGYCSSTYPSTLNHMLVLSTSDPNPADTTNMPDLPVCPARFLQRKSNILSQLSVPDAEYTDASPKGSVDEGIRELIAELNVLEGVVTTSSCAGRVSVFAEGKKTASESEDDGQVAGIGGKGAGGKWLFISHDPVPAGCDEWIRSLGLVDSAPRDSQEHTGSDGRRLIHFKFEPMVSENVLLSSAA